VIHRGSEGALRQVVSVIDAERDRAQAAAAS
jgi:hypothetical protein